MPINKTIAELHCRIINQFGVVKGFQFAVATMWRNKLVHNRNRADRSYPTYLISTPRIITQNHSKVTATFLLKLVAVSHTWPILDEKVRNAIIGTNLKENHKK